MATTVNLRKVGGSVMLPIPSAILEQAGLEVDMSVALQVHEDGIMLRSARKKYSLDDLLTGDFQQGPEERAWTERVSRGRELL